MDSFIVSPIGNRWQTIYTKILILRDNQMRTSSDETLWKKQKEQKRFTPWYRRGTLKVALRRKVDTPQERGYVVGWNGYGLEGDTLKQPHHLPRTLLGNTEINQNTNVSGQSIIK